ncbi:MAG: carboxypeptidase regulatory-like domain-containing protein [Armatimonadota bacterium]|nr:MAG: carboxypeptidase regulatory-like domain-containing protein [Armatimonadota bacterium]
MNIRQNLTRSDTVRGAASATNALLALLAVVALGVASCAVAVADTTITNVATVTYQDDSGHYVVESNAAVTTVLQGYAINGLVRDETGAPVPDARVDASMSARAVATTTTAEDGTYALTGLPAATYNVYVTVSGRVTQIIRGITLGGESSTATLDFRTPDATSWPAGLYMMTVPFTFGDPSPAAVFGDANVKLARWMPDQSGGTYLYWGRDADIPGFSPGLGFWMSAASAVQLTTTQFAAAASENAPYGVALRPGWNMVGNPFCADVQWAAAQVRCNGQTVSLETAARNNWIRPYAWVYDATARQYVLLDATYPGARRTLQVWQACWVRALTTCELLIAPPGAAAASATGAAARSAQPEPQWRVQLIARAGDLCDGFNYMGVVADAAAAADSRCSLQSPPPMSPYVDLTFTGGRGSGAELATDFRPPVAGRAVWDFVVRSDAANAQVVLTWPDLSDVPDRYRLMLVDLDAQRRQYMRTTNSYVFNTSAQGCARRFQVEVDSTPWARLQVRNIQQIIGRASGMTISYDLSSQAVVDVEVRGLTGQLVKVLSRGATASAGTNLFTWDGTDASGRMMPNGPYLCAISAVTEEGQAVKGMRTIVLTR